VFSSPTRMGKPKGSMQRFLKKVRLPTNAKYALIATHGSPQPNKKTGQMPDQAEFEKWQRTLPVMTEILAGKGTKVAEIKIYVRGDTLQGPLLEGWEKQVDEFAEKIVK